MLRHTCFRKRKGGWLVVLAAFGIAAVGMGCDPEGYVPPGELGLSSVEPQQETSAPAGEQVTRRGDFRA